MTEPAKTRCGHSFCKLCIGKVLRKKNAFCPLCKKNLNRRNVSKDDHLEACIIKFTNLVTAIQVDSNIDILSHSKPRDTKESNVSNLPDHSFPANENDNAIFSRPDVKVRTWLQHLPDEETSIEISANLISDNNNKLSATDEIHDNKYNKSNKTNRHRKQIDYKDCIDGNTNTSRISKDTDAKQFDKVLKTDSAATNELKYKVIHDRIRAKNSKEYASKSGVEKTNNRNNSSSIIANDQTHQINDSNSNASAAQSSFADWTRIIEFGKETKRGKKRKIKKLNINTEKNKDAPRIIENISLSSSKKYDLAKIAMDYNMSRKEENGKKQDAFDKNLDSSNAEMMPLEVSSEAYIYNSKECIKDKTNSSISPTNHPIKTLHVTLEAENKQIPIINLTSSQVNEIIGSENINKNSHNRCREKSVEIITEHCNSLLLSPKRLVVLTPEKLNESIREHEMMRDIAQTPASNFRNSSLAENRTPEPEWNNSPQRTLGEVASSQSSQTPKSKARLSLKRKPGISDNKKINSPLLSQVPLIDRLSSNEKDIDHRNINSPVSKNGKLFDRLTAVKRDLNLQIIGKDQLQTNRNTIHSDALLKKQTDGNVSRMICQVEKFVSNLTTLEKSENIKNQECLVKFRQMGTMIKRRNVRYFYLSPTKREQSLPAQVQITSVYNMQQSINKFEMEPYITNMSYNLARSSDCSNESQDMMDITVIENIRSQAVSKDIELSMTSPKVPATSMPKKDIDHYLNRKKIATIEENAQSLHKTIRPNSSAIQKSSRIHSGTSNSIKLLSPDKDSQLKFLTIDSPMSDHGKSKRANSSWQQSELEKSVHIKENNFSKIKNSRFAASMSKAQEPSIENSNKKRKRMRDSSDKELFDDGRNDNSSDSTSGSDRRRIKLGRYSKSSKNIELGLDSSEKYRSTSPDDQNLIEVISSNSKEQNTCTRKFRRILPISSSDTESESAEHVARNCKRPRADDQSEQWNALIMNAPKEKCLSIRFPSEKKLINPRSANHQKSESQNSLTMRESDMFESSSIFNSDNVDYILQQSGSKISEKIAEASNDDIINKVLQIDRLQSNTNACQSLDSTLRNNRMSQKEKNSKEYLLQDNFDEIIANVELPQSNEDAIPCTNQSISRSLKSCPSAKQRMSNCLAMTDELYGAAQETPILSASSTHDIFESCPSKNLKRSMTPAILENFGKENIVSHSQKKHDCTIDRKEKRNVTANTDTIEENPCRRITSKHNVVQEREKFIDESSLAQHINVSINQSTNRSHVDDRTMQKPIVAGDELNLTTDNLFDSLMNVTQHQCQLQKFEEELLGITVNQNQRKTITLQKDPIQEEQHTPEKQKKDTQDKKTAAEVSADEDDVVEKTPERKMKNNGNNISWKQLELRKNISPISKPHISSAEQIPSTSKTKSVSKSSAGTPVKLLEIYPLYQSTPQSSTTNNLKNMRQQFDKQKLCFICSGLTATQLATVKKFATKHNVDYVNQFESDVTHVIVNTIGEKNAAKSTLKFLQGIAHRKWIISYRWIEDCIKQEKLLDEAPYEATTFTDGIIDDGPQRSRLRKKNLFEDFTFWCVGPYLNVSLNQYQNLLLATGATVVDSLEALAKKEGMKGIVIQDGVHDDKEIEHWYRTAKAAPISDGWIVDCIGNYKLFNLAPYIQHLSLQDLCAIGFPQELIGDEEYSDDEE